MNHEHKQPTPASKTEAANDPAYSVLRAHERTDRSHKSLEALEIEYITLTDNLIRQMTEPISMRNKAGEEVKEIPSTVVFLDKSARPLAWLVRDLWPTLAYDAESDTTPPMPDMKFLNIDREHWMNQGQINSHARGLDISTEIAGNLSPEKLMEVRSVYNHDDPSFETPNALDNQNILVVDEVKSSGATLAIAREILKNAFPTSHVAGTHWMSKQIDIGGRGQGYVNADLPVWYKGNPTDPDHLLGRGVANRVADEKTLQAEPWKRFLSSRFPEPDPLSNRLREDLHLLADRLREKEVLYIAPIDRKDDEARMERINGKDYITAMLGAKAIREADKLKDK